MQNICISCEKSFTINNEDLKFYSKLELPIPNYCPSCREARRMAWCNEGTLYFSSCALCNKRSMSQFSPQSQRIGYCRDCWWSEKWNPKDYSIEFNFELPFFYQLKEFLKTVPHCHIHTDLSSENSEFSHHAGHQKNCYMTFHCSFAEDCYYGYGIKKAINCVDCHYCHESELCYECVDIQKCYDLFWSQECKNCSSSRFLYDCIGCKNCFLCTGLRNKQYYYLNEKLSPEEYNKQISLFNQSSYEETKVRLFKFQSLKNSYKRKNLQMLMVENCLGNNLYNSKNSYHCFDSSELEDCSYCSQIQFGAKHCYDIYQFGINIENCCDCSMIGYNIYNCSFCYDLLEQCNNLQYCLSCHSCKDCFACFGLKKAQYCIFNKQYNKEAYHELKSRIIIKMKSEGTYGSYFPISLSPHCYNETTAQVWYPKTKEEVLSTGLVWQDKLPFTTGNSTLNEFPSELRQDLINEIFACENCSRDYKINLKELNFYFKNKIALPRKCFNCRRGEREKLRDSRNLAPRRCCKCNLNLSSTIVAPRNVLCEQCHNNH